MRRGRHRRRPACSGQPPSGMPRARHGQPMRFGQPPQGRRDAPGTVRRRRARRHRRGPGRSSRPPPGSRWSRERRDRWPSRSAAGHLGAPGGAEQLGHTRDVQVCVRQVGGRQGIAAIDGDRGLGRPWARSQPTSGQPAWSTWIQAAARHASRASSLDAELVAHRRAGPRGSGVRRAGADEARPRAPNVAPGPRSHEPGADARPGQARDDEIAGDVVADDRDELGRDAQPGQRDRRRGRRAAAREHPVDAPRCGRPRAASRRSPSARRGRPSRCTRPAARALGCRAGGSKGRTERSRRYDVWNDRHLYRGPAVTAEARRTEPCVRFERIGELRLGERPVPAAGRGRGAHRAPRGGHLRHGCAHPRGRLPRSPGHGPGS